MDKEITIDELKNRIDELTEHVDNLQDQIYMLTKSKLQDPRYPYSHWLLTKRISKKTKKKLKYALFILNQRFNNEPMDKSIIMVTSNECIHDILYRNTIPTYDEASTILKDILQLETKDNKGIISLLKCIYKQGLFRDLCKHLLKEIGERPFTNFDQFDMD